MERTTIQARRRGKMDRGRSRGCRSAHHVCSKINSRPFPFLQLLLCREQHRDLPTPHPGAGLPRHQVTGALPRSSGLKAWLCSREQLLGAGLRKLC